MKKENEMSRVKHLNRSFFGMEQTAGLAETEGGLKQHENQILLWPKKACWVARSTP